MTAVHSQLIRGLTYKSNKINQDLQCLQGSYTQHALAIEGQACLQDNFKNLRFKVLSITLPYYRTARKAEARWNKESLPSVVSL